MTARGGKHRSLAPWEGIHGGLPVSSAFQPRRETVDTLNEPGWMLGRTEDRGPHVPAVANREIRVQEARDE